MISTGKTGAATLIVVDDDKGILAAIQRVFRNEPYDVLLSDDPFEALARIKDRPIDAVIADEYMPGMLGTDLLEAARRHFPLSARIVLTGYPGSRDSVQARPRTVDLVLAKPWEDGHLRSAVRALLEAKRERPNHRGPYWHGRLGIS